MLLTILTEGGHDVGFGHITRCISIASAFQLRGVEVRFLVYGDKSIDVALTGMNYQYIDWISDFEKTKLLVMGSSIILLDSLTISGDHIIRISSLNIPVIHIDDEKQQNIINNGFILDWTVNRDYRCKFKHGVEYLIGSKYTPLRQDFYNAPPYIVNQKIQRIMLTVGGSDLKNITPGILQTLVDNCPNIKKEVIIGGGFRNLSAIKDNMDKNTNLVVGPDSKKMVEIMQQCDLAIACGGQTLYELAKIGVPTIATIVVDNAVSDTIGWEEVGFLRNIGWHHDSGVFFKLITEIQQLKDYSIRKEMSENARKLMKSNGADLIANRVIRKISEGL